MELVTIDRRFRGPPQSGNGGYVAGLLAAAFGGTGCTVTLKAPPPLGTELRIEAGADKAALFDGERLVAEAAPVAVAPDVPPPPTLAEARAAQERFAGFATHPFPGCFVCGPEREDGLRIFPGRLTGNGGLVAAVWRPDPSLADADGTLRPEFVWAGLDCPGYFAVQGQAGPAVLGRLGVDRVAPVPVDEPLIVTGWPTDSAGRKHLAGTALFAADGRLLARALATWISIGVSAPG